MSVEGQEIKFIVSNYFNETLKEYKEKTSTFDGWKELIDDKYNYEVACIAEATGYDCDTVLLKAYDGEIQLDSLRSILRFCIEHRDS